MKLNDCRSVDLTPVNYADRLGWACAAFDEFVHTLDARRFALAAPFAMTAIQALTDEEMQVYYREIGLAPYYADLPRTSRENMLFAELANLRKLGTVAAVEALCQYIFGDTPIALEIVDNLAFDASGNLTNASLLNLYDVIVTIDNPVLDQFQLSRIFSNVTRFGRVSQKLRGIVMRYSGGECTAYAGAGSVEYAVHYENWEICTLNSEPGDDPRKPLMFLSLQDGSTVKLETHSSYDNTYEVSFDNGLWESYTFGTDITLNEGDKAYFRCTYFTPSNDDRYVRFVMRGKIEAYNNVNSMYSVDFANITTLTQYVFYSLFRSCGALYRAPLLPATSLSEACYAGMFSGCSNLGEPPLLPATSLSAACYAGMFSGCSNLGEPPLLPATSLSAACYASMFLGCSALIKAPELPATDLAANCYYRMFGYCTHLAEVKCAAVNPPSGESSFVGACSDWLAGTSASGTFYADANAVWTNDASGVPSGWTRVSL